MAGDVLLVVGLITFSLMFFGFIRNMRIFNIFSIAGFVVLGLEFKDYAGLVIMFVGLIMFNIYWAFIAEY